MRRQLVPLGSAMLVCLAMACSSEDDDPLAGGGGTNTSAGGQGGSGAATTTSSTTGAGGFTGMGGGGGGEPCLATEAEAEQKPLDMIVLIDRSNSMAGGLWDGTVAALTDFFTDPNSQDIGAGLSFFPPSGSADQCAPSSYNPPHHPIVNLGTSASVLTDALALATPAGEYTPHYGALYGTLQFANEYQDDNPEHVVVVVLASDGDPTACNTNIQDVADLAKIAYDYNGVQTFVIAIDGATVPNLDEIAAAGNTGQALDVTQDITLFKEKMDDIRQQVLACEYFIPDPQGGVVFVPTELNVVYTPGDGSEKQTIPQADDLADCGNGQGWYYDNPVTPTKITFCPATCDLITSDPQAKVDFAFGCPTRIN